MATEDTTSLLPILFFFFQAEDGIRDHCVTGVQTCALPIWKFIVGREERLAVATATAIIVAPGVNSAFGARNWLRTTRSEERRVGKECRSRWWTYHSKKKNQGKERGRRSTK